ncbi:hypothetical protein KDA_46140 [Dictyobacter alpinus]|uniref:VOC domain-containing protein n=1 Tax=Dictyobacter alpinus TaxID=2014873 RepID=A0A402BCU0_9CHLR|nr:VOC family protein [Dictyobacter alpinus]GCE29130.1 hypothetical protein KDA_46140 [Dictyobacter alpinus]
MPYGFGLLGLYVQDIEKAQQFYVDFLGMTLVPENSTPSFVYLLPTKGTPIALQAASTLPAGSPPQVGGFELNLEVEDLKATWQAWQDRGVEILNEITDMGVGHWFRARGPEGQLISVFQMYPQTAQ